VVEVGLLSCCLHRWIGVQDNLCFLGLRRGQGCCLCVFSLFFFAGGFDKLKHSRASYYFLVYNGNHAANTAAMQRERLHRTSPRMGLIGRNKLWIAETPQEKYKHREQGSCSNEYTDRKSD
jgi:hypothetical protein